MFWQAKLFDYASTSSCEHKNSKKRQDVAKLRHIFGLFFSKLDYFVKMA